VFGSVCTCHTWHKRLCTKKKRSMAGETAICRTTAKKRKQDAAINFRIKNPLVSHDKIIEKFALDITVSAFRKACSRAKPKDSLNPTSAKAPPASEPTPPTPSKYPKRGLHDQVMAEASLQLVRNWKKHGSKCHTHGPATVIKQFMDKYPHWKGCDRGTLCRKAKKSPGQAKGVRSGVLPTSQGNYLMQLISHSCIVSCRH
jgi:hypothetical protein